MLAGPRPFKNGYEQWETKNINENSLISKLCEWRKDLKNKEQQNAVH